MASAPLSFVATSPAPRPGAGLGPLSLPHLSTDETTESVSDCRRDRLPRHGPPIRGRLSAQPREGTDCV